MVELLEDKWQKTPEASAGLRCTRVNHMASKIVLSNCNTVRFDRLASVKKKNQTHFFVFLLHLLIFMDLFELKFDFMTTTKMDL